MKVLHRFQESMVTERALILNHYEYPIIRETKHGAWIDVLGHAKFVRLDARKRFACPTVEEAMESFRRRKQRQVKLLRAQLRMAEAALELKTVDDVWFEVFQ